MRESEPFKMRINKSVPIVVAGATVLALAGCAGGATGSGSGSDNAEITYAIWDENQVPALEQNIEDFNKEHPEITVKIDVTPWEQYWTKLQTQASSKTLPDIFWMNGPNFQLYAGNDQLAPITDGVDPANYPDALNELYSLDGTQYAVPKDFDTVAVWYNKTLLEQAGVAEPTADWTWDDFKESSKQVSDALKSEGIFGTVAGLSNGQSSYYDTIFQAGGEVITEDGKSGYDSPEAIEGLQFWADLIADGSSPTLNQLADTEAKAYFSSGKAAFFWSGTWDVSMLAETDVKDVVSVVPLPKDKEQATVIHGLANVVSANTKNIEAAQTFQEFLGTEEAQRTQAEMGAANPAFNDTQKAFVDSVPSFNLQVFLDAAEYAKPYPVSRNTAAWTQLESDLLPAALSGERPVAEVAKELAEQMNAALADE